jgi:parvulin-like peptidyl-prolyl isomerase
VISRPAAASASALAVGLLTLTLGACSRDPEPAPAPSGDPARPLPSPLPDIVARVNGQPIHLKSILPLAKAELELAAREEEKVDALPRVLRSSLDRYITREVMLQEAMRRGLAADDASIEQAYNELRVRFPDEKGWEKNLRDQGFDAASFRTELRIQAALGKLGVDEAQKASPVSDEEAEVYYNTHKDELRLDEVRVRHLLFALPPAATHVHRSAARARATNALVRLKQGEAFAVLALSLSDDKATREKGGELPPFHRGQTDPAFEAAAFALKPGQVSDAVETSAGVHIIELLSRREGGLPPFSAYAPEIKERLMKEHRAEAVKRLEDDLRARARIEIYL